MLLAEDETRLFASHHQIHVEDSGAPGGTSGWTWTRDDCDNRLVVLDGFLAIGTGSYEIVKVRVERHDAEPPLNESQWDHITEAGLDMRGHYLLIRGCLATTGLFVDVTPGHYRVRACHANLAESEQEVPADWTGDFGDWYLLQIWPAAPAAPQVIKRRQQT